MPLPQNGPERRENDFSFLDDEPFSAMPAAVHPDLASGRAQFGDIFRVSLGRDGTTIFDGNHRFDPRAHDFDDC